MRLTTVIPPSQSPQRPPCLPDRLRDRLVSMTFIGFRFLGLFRAYAVFFIEPLQLRLFGERYHVHTVALLGFEIQLFSDNGPDPFARDLSLVVHSVAVDEP